MHNRLILCGKHKRAAASATKKCLKDPFKGFHEKHCQILKECNNQTLPSCAVPLKATRSATCTCVAQARRDLKRRMAGVSKAVKAAISGEPGVSNDSQISACINAIRAEMATPVNDWIAILDSALEKCIVNKPAGQLLGVNTLITAACRKIVSNRNGNAMNELNDAFDFLYNLLEVMILRSNRFCGATNCDV